MSRHPAKASKSATPAAQALQLSRDVEEELREAVGALERGEGLVLSLTELEAWGETGEFPWPDESLG